MVLQFSWLLAALVMGHGIALRVVLSRRNLAPAFASASGTVLLPQRTFADNTLVNCRAACFKECNSLAPGNKKYCASQCDSYCEEAGPVGSKDVVRSDLSNAVDDVTKQNTANAKAGAHEKSTEISTTAKVSFAGPTI
mmetsp:Transcript_47626/g.78796  ORF Transcript_47626/g.78796 Transcript_47626/m.78796 type:complete len:138 (+) Transcript_47626:60-473(+)